MYMFSLICKASYISLNKALLCISRHQMAQNKIDLYMEKQSSNNHTFFYVPVLMDQSLYIYSTKTKSNILLLIQWTLLLILSVSAPHWASEESVSSICSMCLFVSFCPHNSAHRVCFCTLWYNYPSSSQLFDTNMFRSYITVHPGAPLSLWYLH